MSVPDSLAFDLGSRLCNSDVLALFSYGHGQLLYGGPGSAPQIDMDGYLFFEVVLKY